VNFTCLSHRVIPERKALVEPKEIRLGHIIMLSIFYVYLHKLKVICASAICILLVFVNFSLGLISNDISLQYKEIIYLITSFL